MRNSVIEWIAFIWQKLQRFPLATYKPKIKMPPSIFLNDATTLHIVSSEEVPDLYSSLTFHVPSNLLIFCSINSWVSP